MINPPLHKTCNYGGKVCYSKKMAGTVKNTAMKERDIKLEIYQCKNCNYWHLTHNLTYRKFK